MSERPRLSPDELIHATTIFHAEKRPVRFQDVDAAGIIFFARVLEYFHDAWVAFLPTIGVDLVRVLEEGAWGMPLGHAEADYLGPMRFGDEVVVEVVRVDLGARSILVGSRVRSPEGRVLAIGQITHVCIDRAAFRSRPLPEELVAAIRAAEERARAGA